MSPTHQGGGLVRVLLHVLVLVLILILLLMLGTDVMSNMMLTDACACPDGGVLCFVVPHTHVVRDWEVYADTLADALRLPKTLESRIRAAAVGNDNAYDGLGRSSRKDNQLITNSCEGRGEKLAGRMCDAYSKAVSLIALLYGADHEFHETLVKKKRIFESIAIRQRV